MTRFPHRRPAAPAARLPRQGIHDVHLVAGDDPWLALGVSAPAVAAAQRAGRRLRDMVARWACGLLRAPVRFTVSADDPAALQTLAANAPPGVRARCVQARVRLGGDRMKLIRVHVEVRGHADVATLRRWILQGLRDYPGDVRINGVLVDRRARRL